MSGVSNQFLDRHVANSKVAKGCIAKWLLNVIWLAIALINIYNQAIASEDQLHSNVEVQPLQTEITQSDLKIIGQLVAIAEHKSATLMEAKTAMGLSSFADVISLELSPSQSTRNYVSADVSSENERSFSFTVTVDAIRLINAFVQRPVMEARWNEAKHQKRVIVVQHYLAYIQARQTSKIATYKMQTFIANSRVAGLNDQTKYKAISNHLANPDYVALATEKLNANAREWQTLEELAASVGLSSEAIIPIINEQLREKL